MKTVKSLLFVALAAMSISASAKATYTEGDEVYTFKPHWFIQAQIGGAYTLGEAKFTDLISPTAQVALGYQFNHVWALRLAVSGWESKGGWGKSTAQEFGLSDNTFKWNYVTPAIDVKFNIVNAIAGYNPKRLFGLNIIAGVGANIAFGHGEIGDIYAVNPTLVSHYADTKGTDVKPVGRVGLDFDFRCSDRVSVNLEGNANFLSDHYNSKHADNVDQYYNVLAGVKINLGKTYTKTSVAPVYQTVIDTTWYDDVTYKEVPVQENTERYVYYNICRSDLPDPASEMDAVAAFVKSHKNCKVTVTGYADKGTGNAKVNLKYSKQRADKATQGLIDRGIDPNIITTDAKGDTVQPFDENDKNRVVIAVASGEGTTKQKVVTKKFRTNERQVRIK